MSSNHLHPIPRFLVNPTPILLRWQHSQGRGTAPGNESWLLPALHGSTSPPQMLVREWFTHRHAIHFWAVRWSLLGPSGTKFLPWRKERCRALTPLSIKSALEVPVSGLLFMWNYKDLLPKWHLIRSSITCSPKYLHLQTLLDLLSNLQGHCPKYAHLLHLNLYINRISPHRYPILFGFFHM